jgi:hypothetical protein
MFSVGVLYSAQEFLKLVIKEPKIGNDFPDMFASFSVASPKAILEVSQKCEWVQLNTDGYLYITDRGHQILDANQPEIALRIQLGFLIETYLPPWMPLLTRGRSEAQKYLSADVLQCMKEAGLFGYPNDDIVSWWDTHSKLSRKAKKDHSLETGRQGEKLSIAHERKRTQKEPKWTGFETNFAGFDILSVLDRDSSEPLRIEVKTCNSDQNTALFYVSRNEWNTAATSSNYIFHLWSIKKAPKLIIVSSKTMEKHIPTDNGNGYWEKVSIPFSAFF